MTNLSEIVDIEAVEITKENVYRILDTMIPAELAEHIKGNDPEIKSLVLDYLVERPEIDKQVGGLLDGEDYF